MMDYIINKFELVWGGWIPSQQGMGVGCAQWDSHVGREGPRLRGGGVSIEQGQGWGLGPHGRGPMWDREGEHPQVNKFDQVGHLGISPSTE